MKKILSIALSSVLLLTACDLDINDNPNFPGSADVTTDLIFPSAENFIADVIGDDMFTNAGFFAQYFDQMPTANQYNDLAELNINEGKNLFNRDYRLLFAGALNDLKDIMDRSTNTADIFACTVLRAYAYQVLVDCQGEAPYTEALQGASNLTPMWDDGKTIYEGVLAELDEAEENLDAADIITLTDPLLSQELSEWIGFANALRLRMLLRLIDGNVNVEANTAKVKALVADDNFFSGDVTWDVYSNAEGQYNPWFDCKNTLGASNHCAAFPIVTYMTGTEDPRISYAMDPAEYDGTYTGQIPGSKTKTPGWLGLTTSEYQNDRVSNIKYDVFRAAPVYFYTQSELQFLIAEVELRFNHNDAAAKAAYEAAVEIDFDSKGADEVDTFLTGFGEWKGSDTEKLNLIYMQKWVALFMRDHLEAWTEARRTDIPAVSPLKAEAIANDVDQYNAGDFIVPAVNQYGEGGLCKRVPYSSDARSTNKNTPAAKGISVPVFWDIK
ncbi:MAG: SusD/RagB family nutrient-binding outer membrane lipoprotein [Bacteroidaceae bacterium]|nr:SusD/RagB family nutrient-binding outer membrane lipoprotein [Bacteroidaceae bacterium]